MVDDLSRTVEEKEAALRRAELMAKEIETEIRNQLLPNGRAAVDRVALSSSADDAVEALEI